MAFSSSLPPLKVLYAIMQEVAQSDKTLQKKFHAVVHFDVDGETCTITSSSSSSSPPQLRVKTSLKTLQALINKEITPQQAFMKGKLKIKGKMSLAMKLTLLLDATRNQLKQQQQSKL